MPIELNECKREIRKRLCSLLKVPVEDSLLVFTNCDSQFRLLSLFRFPFRHRFSLVLSRIAVIRLKTQPKSRKAPRVSQVVAARLSVEVPGALRRGACVANSCCGGKSELELYSNCGLWNFGEVKRRQKDSTFSFTEIRKSN